MLKILNYAGCGERPLHYAGEPQTDPTTNTDEDRTETSQRYGEVETFDYSERLFFHRYFQAFSV